MELALKAQKMFVNICFSVHLIEKLSPQNDQEELLQLSLWGPGHQSFKTLHSGGTIE